MALRAWSLAMAALACATASCAFEFGEYDLEQPDTSTSTTSSGGSGGSGPLAADGLPCDGPEECQSGHCLPSNTESGSVCCAVDCDVSDPDTCGTNGNCDASGADCALYPAGFECGDPTCADGVLTSAQCSGATCQPGATTPCGGGLDCADTSTCNVVCKTSEECANPSDATTGAECEVDHCAARPDGAPCNENSQCESKVCGTTGVGRCCASACPPGEGACSPTDCDSEGECVFPTGETACGTDPSCMNGNLSTVYCNGSGDCTLQANQPCPGHLGCESATSCHETCGSNDATGDARCPAGYWCDGAICLQASWDEGSACLRDGQCSSNDCTSAGACTAAGCDVDGDGFIRDDPHCVGDAEERDCDDNDARAHPGQTDFFDTPRSSGGYDFDCNAVDEPQHPTSCLCAGYALLVPAGPAGCGVTGSIRTCYQFFLCGVNDTANTGTQLCR